MPAATVDYYFATVSPWAYLGHARFVAMTQAAGATVHFVTPELDPGINGTHTARPDGSEVIAGEMKPAPAE